jgi:uncharacterized membrane protein
MWFLVLLGILLLIGLLAIVRHSRGFRGSAAHFADEDRRDVKLSKGWHLSDIGGSGE